MSMNQDLFPQNSADMHERLKMIVEVMTLEAEPDKSKRILANSTTVGERLELLKVALNPPVAPEIKSEPETLPEPLVEIPPEPPPLTRYTRAGKWFAWIVLTLLLK